MNKQFKRCSDFVREKIKESGPGLLPHAIYYGECCVQHTMSYDWEKIPPFLGFDIKLMDDDATHYMEYDMKKELFEAVNLPMVPLLFKGKYKDMAIKFGKIRDEVVPKSVYQSLTSKDQQAEGIVIKNYNKQLFAKYVRDAFKEANAEAFGGNPKYNKDEHNDNAVVVFKYCTNARIDKMIFKLIDEGLKLEMPLMKVLPTRVYADIMEEEWENVVYSKWVIDFSKLKRLITKRCLAVLQQVLVNNSLNEEQK